MLVMQITEASQTSAHPCSENNKTTLRKAEHYTSSTNLPVLIVTCVGVVYRPHYQPLPGGSR